METTFLPARDKGKAGYIPPFVDPTCGITLSLLVAVKKRTKGLLICSLEVEKRREQRRKLNLKCLALISISLADFFGFKQARRKEYAKHHDSLVW